jgi:MSHA biogenesis protein MshQ
MAITFINGATTTATGAVTGVTVAEPGSLTATSLSILVVEVKNNAAGTAATITTPTGWTIIGTVTNNGTLAPTNDAGSNGVGVYYRVGSGYGATTITTTGANSMGAGIAGYATSLGGWDTTTLTSVTTTGSDTTSAANGSITGGATIAFTTNDWVLLGTGLSGDLGSVTAESLAATGATIGSRANRSNLGVSTGNDSRLLITDWPITAGPASAAPVYTWTNTSALTGHARFVVLREQAAVFMPQRPTVINQAALIRAHYW